MARTFRGGHHYYGHAGDADEVGNDFNNMFWIMMFILIGIPLMLAIPSLAVLVLLIWVFLK